ncbi:MAG: antitoxin Xre/MbcA/ParS toxin-binding domain-containing protein [Weeksellaceae bacterium]
MPKPYKQKPIENNFVEDAPTYFYSGNAAIPLSELTSIQKMKIIRGGVSKNYLEDFKRQAGLDYDTLARALGVTRSTLINKKANMQFNDQLAERIIALADLYSFGYEVFGDEANFNHWMAATNQALNGLSPLDFIDNQYGRDEIRNLIGRIAYGVYS